MRRDAFLGDPMHLGGTDLYFERLATRNYRCVERLISVRSWQRDEILNTAGDRAPGVMNHAQGGITVLHTVCDDPKRQEVVHFVDRDTLFSKFQEDRIEPLYTGFNLAGNAVFLHLGVHHSSDFVEKDFMGLSLSLDDFFQLLVTLRFEIAECQILEFASDFPHSEPVSQRGIDLQR